MQSLGHIWKVSAPANDNFVETAEDERSIDEILADMMTAQTPHEARQAEPRGL